jgi:hypothetical protein
MQLHSPFCITARLLPGVQVGNDYISIEYAGDTASGRTRYRCYLDIGDKEYESDDLKSGCQGGGLQEGMASLCCFLEACGESYGYKMRNPHSEPENLGLFPEWVAEWAYQHSDELSMIEMEIEESETELIEE